MSASHPLPPIVLLTDFGTQDAYVGMLKGVIQRTCPGAPMIDLTHAIPPQDIRQAAFVLWTAYRYFPAGSVFLAVVDPGVGSERRPVAIEAGGFRFVGPDNGVFDEVLAELGDWQGVAIDPAVIALPEGLTATFHGRDLFAPAAARLLAGEPLAALGASLETLVTLKPARFEVTDLTIEGEIILIDHFGNGISSIGACRWQADGTLRLEPRFHPDLQPLTLNPDRVRVTVARYHLPRIARTYAEVEPGHPIALISSSGQLEIAVNQGSAQSHLDLAPGSRITIHRD